MAAEIKRLNDEGGHRYGDAAVFYRTNAQSQTFEEAFIQIGMPYKVVGGVRFYERREVRDAIAYLRTIANRSDDVSLRRILNVPKRGIGDRASRGRETWQLGRASALVMRCAEIDEIQVWRRAPGNQLTAFARFLDDHEAMVAEGMPADAILTSVLDRSRAIWRCCTARPLQGRDAAGEPEGAHHGCARIRHRGCNLTCQKKNWTSSGCRATPTRRRRIWPLRSTRGRPGGGGGRTGCVVGRVLGASRTRRGLRPDTARSDETNTGVVTLMTLHTAKGLEFDTVFLTGCEDGVFPHQRAIAERTGSELAEERRLAYVGITQAASGSTSLARSPGRPGARPAQSTKPVPERGAQPTGRLAAYGGYPITSAANTSATATQTWRNTVGYGAQPTVRQIPSSRLETGCCIPRSAWVRWSQLLAKATRRWPTWTLDPPASSALPAVCTARESSSS